MLYPNIHVHALEAIVTLCVQIWQLNEVALKIHRSCCQCSNHCPEEAKSEIHERIKYRYLVTVHVLLFIAMLKLISLRIHSCRGAWKISAFGSGWSYLRSWRDFARECFCFGREAVNTSGEAVRALVKKFPRGLREGIWRLRRWLAHSRIPPATQARLYGNSRFSLWASEVSLSVASRLPANSFSKGAQSRYLSRIRKIEAKLFNVRNPWRSSFKGQTETWHGPVKFESYLTGIHFFSSPASGTQLWNNVLVMHWPRLFRLSEIKTRVTMPYSDREPC